MIPLSARTSGRPVDLCRSFRDFLSDAPDDVDLRDVAYSAGAARRISSTGWRSSSPGGTRPSAPSTPSCAASRTSPWSRAAVPPDGPRLPCSSSRRAERSGRHAVAPLFRREPAFRAAIERCDRRGELGWSLVAALERVRPFRAAIRRPRGAVRFAVQVALAAPLGILGHRAGGLRRRRHRRGRGRPHLGRARPGGRDEAHRPRGGCRAPAGRGGCETIWRSWPRRSRRLHRDRRRSRACPIDPDSVAGEPRIAADPLVAPGRGSRAWNRCDGRPLPSMPRASRSIGRGSRHRGDSSGCRPIPGVANDTGSTRGSTPRNNRPPEAIQTTNVPWPATLTNGDVHGRVAASGSGMALAGASATKRSAALLEPLPRGRGRSPRRVARTGRTRTGR